MVEDILFKLKEIVRGNGVRLVFPEGDDIRVLKACRILKDEGLVNPVILRGDKAKVILQENNISGEGLEILDFSDFDLDKYASVLFEKRKHKGLSLDDAKILVLDVNYLGVLLVDDGFVDGMVSGAVHPTPEVLRPALQIIKTKGVSTASSFFMMSKGDQVFFFADCGFVVNPSSSELADIALCTSESVKKLGFDPRVALLSFSSKGSSNHESLNKIRDALSLIKNRTPELVVDGELQLDAAIVPGVAELKGSEIIKGDANILIFPDLNSGNIGYKLVERLGGFKAVGPIVQGLRKPVNDLSRGCSVDDIVSVAVITSLEVEK